MTILDYSNHKKKGLDFLEEMRELRRRKGDTQEHSVCGCVPTEHSARHQWLLQLGTSEKPTRWHFSWHFKWQERVEQAKGRENIPSRLMEKPTDRKEFAMLPTQSKGQGDLNMAGSGWLVAVELKGFDHSCDRVWCVVWPLLNQHQPRGTAAVSAGDGHGLSRITYQRQEVTRQKAQSRRTWQWAEREE